VGLFTDPCSFHCPVSPKVLPGLLMTGCFQRAPSPPPPCLIETTVQISEQNSRPCLQGLPDACPPDTCHFPAPLVTVPLNLLLLLHGPLMSEAWDHAVSFPECLSQQWGFRCWNTSLLTALPVSPVPPTLLGPAASPFQPSPDVSPTNRAQGPSDPTTSLTHTRQQAPAGSK
jgi:hypothetical protein